MMMVMMMVMMVMNDDDGDEAATQKLGPHFVRACAVEMHVSMSEEPLHAEIYRKNVAPQNRGADFVRACAVETHVNISQEPICTEIYRKKAREQSEHPDQAPAFTATVRTPQCGHTVWGIKVHLKFLPPW